jgi:hypothetical protein
VSPFVDEDPVPMVRDHADANHPDPSLSSSKSQAVLEGVVRSLVWPKKEPALRTATSDEVATTRNHSAGHRHAELSVIGQRSCLPPPHVPPNQGPSYNGKTPERLNGREVHVASCFVTNFTKKGSTLERDLRDLGENTRLSRIAQGRWLSLGLASTCCNLGWLVSRPYWIGPDPGTTLCRSLAAGPRMP